MFHGQFKATEKVLAGKDLNAYETFSTYCMHTACWMFGWVISPETARLVFCKQFFIDPNPKNYKVHDDERLKEIKRQLIRQGAGATRRMTWKDYSVPRTSLFLNGSPLILVDIENGVAHWRYTVLSDFRPGIPLVTGIQLSETLLDYLENKNIVYNPVFYLDEYQNIEEIR